MQTTAYDTVLYPSTLSRQAHPDRLACIARLHGLDPPNVETARVLEIGGGDGSNLIAIAEAYPKGSFVSFDLAQTVADRGQAYADQIGLDNIRIEQGDVLERAETMEGPFDYVIAHGLYAWVPDSVREGVWKLMKRVLAPNGIGMVSYNALPGCYLRLALRDRMLLETRNARTPQEKMTIARQWLQAFADEPEPEDAFLRALQDQAAKTLRRSPEGIYHDELGAFFAPQQLTDVAAASARHGLRYFGEASPGLQDDGFLDEDDDAAGEGDPVVAAQRRDFTNTRFFRNSLFVHDTVEPAQRFDVGRMDNLFVSADCTRQDGNVFVGRGGSFEIKEQRLASVLDRLSDAFPERLSISALDLTDDLKHNLFRLFDLNLVMLHANPLPFSLEVGARPEASRLVRRQLADGSPWVFTLDHRTLSVPEPGSRAMITMLDGTRDHATLERLWNETPYAKEETLVGGLGKLVRIGLIKG